ncbi:hypothetical protein FOL47_003334 [Perkinsus chesapeaki]|uniref:Uncharacterized protein n=1 Tax=Perkinsus chesapeaki TaxID=330153 RepID=A0A7J6MA89_PERCH|nr:hypothetical protein FOL47_003334 [Perkinsus chesapeaki]
MSWRQDVPADFPYSFTVSEWAGSASSGGRPSVKGRAPDANTRELQERIIKCIRLPDRMYFCKRSLWVSLRLLVQDSHGVGLSPSAAREDLWRGLVYTAPIVGEDWQESRTFHVSHQTSHREAPQPVSLSSGDDQQPPDASPEAES